MLHMNSHRRGDMKLCMHVNRTAKTIVCKLLLVGAFLLFYGLNQVEASDRNRYTSRPNTIFCKSLMAMRTLQTSLSLQEGKGALLLNSRACEIAPTEVVVNVVQEEKDAVRVQPAGSGKYFWVSRNALR